MPQPAVHNSGNSIIFSGDWLSSAARPQWREYIAANPPAGNVTLDASAVGKWDSTLLVFIGQLIRSYSQDGYNADWSKLPQGVVKIIRLSQNGPKTTPSLPAGISRNLLEILGDKAFAVYDAFLSIAALVGAIVSDTFAIIAGRSQMRICDLRSELMRCGPQAVPIVSLIGFLMGLILAFIGSIPLKWFGAESYVASLVGIGMLRLMAPVMVGVVMAGRNGAAYAAELGAMEVNEEIDALRTLGISPTAFLVLPRFLAMTLMMPLLCVYANLVSIYGGASVAVLYMRQTSLAYFTMLYNTTRINDLTVGLITATVLGMCVAVCGCYQGMHCGRSAEAVGAAATSAVVYSIVCTTVAVALITIITVLFKF